MCTFDFHHETNEFRKLPTNNKKGGAVDSFFDWSGYLFAEIQVVLSTVQSVRNYVHI